MHYAIIHPECKGTDSLVALILRIYFQFVKECDNQLIRYYCLIKSLRTNQYLYDVMLEFQ